MATARRSSAKNPNPDGAHGPSEGQPTAKGKGSKRPAKPAASSKASKAAAPAKAKRGAAASAARSSAPAKAKAAAAATLDRPLTAKESAFVEHYATDPNATQAYLASHPGATYQTARVEGSRLLANPRIAAAVEQVRAVTMAALGITRERVLQEIARLALFDPRKLFDSDGRPLAIQELDDDTAAALAGMDVLEEFEGSGKDRVFVGLVKKYKLADKNTALDKLSRHLGLYEKDNRQAADALGSLLAGLGGRSAVPVVKDPADD